MSKTLGSELLFKIIVIGQSSTGKSCLMLRYMKDEFKTKHQATVGVEFATKKIDMDDNYSVKLQVWDTAGQESFRSIVRNFYRNCSAVFLVYNITKRKTFGALNSWLKQARENSPRNVMFVLVGTHLDQVEENPELREVQKEEAEKWMIQENISLFFETSAKSNSNVGQAFKQAANQLFVNYIKSRSNSASLFQRMMEDMNLLQGKHLTEKAKPTSNCC